MKIRGLSEIVMYMDFMGIESLIKLQILRMLINIAGDRIENQVFWDYLTEYYHVDNNEMTSLDDKRFDIIPNYIMNMADEIIDKIFK